MSRFKLKNFKGNCRRAAGTGLLFFLLQEASLYAEENIDERVSQVDSQLATSSLPKNLSDDPEAKSNKRKAHRTGHHSSIAHANGHKVRETHAEEKVDRIAAYAEVQVSSAYIWRGVLYDDVWNLQPYVELSITELGPGTLGLNFWAYVSMQSATHEVAPGVSYNISSDNISITGGYSPFITADTWKPYLHSLYVKGDLFANWWVYPSFGITADPFKAQLLLFFGGLKFGHSWEHLSLGGQLFFGGLYDYKLKASLEALNPENPMQQQATRQRLLQRTQKLVFHHIDPSLYFAWHPHEAWGLRLSVGWGYDGQLKTASPWWQLAPSVNF